MLLQFAVENFKSFKSEAVLNLIPAKSRIHPDHVLTGNTKGKPVKAVPLAVLYGANASGKSVLIQAIAFAQSLITNGTRGDDPLGITPFKLDKETLSKPSRFEFVLKHEGVLYTYGFVASAKQVHEEWLFAVNESHEKRVFERVTKEGKAVVEAGDLLTPTKEEKQRIQFVAEGTRPNQLFLTEANERNVEPLKALMNWFRFNLRVVFPEAKYLRLVSRVDTDDRFSRFLAEFLQAADTGIQGIAATRDSASAEQLLERMSDEERSRFLEEPESFQVWNGDQFVRFERGGKKSLVLLSLKTRHETIYGDPVNFDVTDESDGTRRLMHLAPALFDSQSGEDVYVIDELDRSLHPLLCRLYVEAFLRSVTEGKSRGQMVVSTHETSLLDLDLLRRDEIWFVEKDKEGGSHLTSLAEFKSQVRADLKIAKGYLNGRFGAIPFLGDVRRLLVRK